jgi:hypothetical protein
MNKYEICIPSVRKLNTYLSLGCFCASLGLCQGIENLISLACSLQPIGNQHLLHDP